MSEDDEDLVDWEEFEAVRQQLGASFARILLYFAEDGVKSVEAIEKAMHERNSVALVVPAHTLKGEAAQLCATPLSALAEEIEMAARHFVETQESPEELVPAAARLRPMFEKTIALLERATNPLVERRREFGQKQASNQKFGRI